ncbi:glycerate kinase [Hydrogenovibrio sp. 3SP14C1]|uniref:glycerate kinase n=1 Tax=Hydrogenovibrio sp. 3SP14C1 TaxID=3038774 RepID=UPI002417766C|nr:glycerate kinase [Hydrogenovibrio sp. 3SP14C1]MDG4813129.1 glycerate kinase [Hydrogenovibrio sp. 3SP14C1]
MNTPKTILVAPDSFKGSLSAVSFCRIAEKVGKAYPNNINIISRPMSDGGEGFVEALIYAELAEVKTVVVQDPLGRATTAKFAWQPETKTAIVEMAQASGLPLLAAYERNPLKASTYGTGQVLNAAMDLGAEKIILGLGGSATNDGGAGALQSLGFAFLDRQGDSISLGGEALISLSKIIKKSPGLVETKRKPIDEIEWVIACDVSNPLLGEQGATTVFGPQKGVDEQSHQTLENGLARLAEVLKEDWGQDIKDLPGAGAAGGMAGSFVGLLNAQLVSGFDLLSELLRLEELFQSHSIDLVVTGEGKMDTQTQFGKLPNRIAQLASRYHVPAVGVCGRLETSVDALNAFMDLRCIHEGVEEATPLEVLLEQTDQNLEKTFTHYFPSWLSI